MTTPRNGTETKKSPLSVAIAAVAVVLVLVIGVAVGLALRGSNDNHPDAPRPPQPPHSAPAKTSSSTPTSSSTSSSSSSSSTTSSPSSSSTSTTTSSTTSSSTTTTTTEPNEDGFSVPGGKADARGWVDTAARCADGDQAFAVLASDKGTTAVACERTDGSKYYRGDGPAGSIDAPIIVDEGDRIVAQNGEWKYQIAPDRLVVTKNNKTQEIQQTVIWGRK